MTNIPFGKHKDRDIAEIAEDDPSYLRWLLKQDWFLEKFDDLVDEVEMVLDEIGESR